MVCEKFLDEKKNVFSNEEAFQQKDFIREKMKRDF